MIDAGELKKYALFGGLTEERIEKLLPLMGYETFEEGRIVMSEGDRNGKIYFMLEGKVEVSRGGLKITELWAGNTFGEMEVIDIMPAAATIRALSPVRAMSISNKALYEIYKTDLDAFAMIIMNLARDLSRRLRRMDERAAGESPPMEWN